MTVSKETAEVMRALSTQRVPVGSVDKLQLDALIGSSKATIDALSDSEVERRVHEADAVGLELDDNRLTPEARTVIFQTLARPRYVAIKDAKRPTGEPDMVEILAEAARAAGWDLDAARRRLMTVIQSSESERLSTRPSGSA